MSEPTSDPDQYRTSHSAPAKVSRPGFAGWIGPFALVVSLLAAGAAGWALLKPVTAADTSTASVDPEGQVCAAFKTVSTGVFRYSHADPSGEPGLALAAAQEAVAANARLAMSGGATYLLRNLSANTPAELADTVRSFAGTLDTVAMKLLAGTPNTAPEMADLLKSTDESGKKITDLCK